MNTDPNRYSKHDESNTATDPITCDSGLMDTITDPKVCGPISQIQMQIPQKKIYLSLRERLTDVATRALLGGWLHSNTTQLHTRCASSTHLGTKEGSGCGLRSG